MAKCIPYENQVRDTSNDNQLIACDTNLDCPEGLNHCHGSPSSPSKGLRDTVVQETVCMTLVLKLVTIKMASLMVYAMKMTTPLHLANVITILSKET